MIDDDCIREAARVLRRQAALLGDHERLDSAKRIASRVLDHVAQCVADGTLSIYQFDDEDGEANV